MGHNVELKPSEPDRKWDCGKEETSIYSKGGASGDREMKRNTQYGVKVFGPLTFTLKFTLFKSMSMDMNLTFH